MSWVKIPWGLKMCALISAVFGLGVTFLTTIDSGLKVSLYAGIGAGMIVFSITLIVWVIYAHGKKEGWTF